MNELIELNYKVKNKIKLIICLIFTSLLFSNNCDKEYSLIQEYFNESISYYPFSFFDFKSEQIKPLLYKYVIKNENEECREILDVKVQYSIFSPSIGINSFQEFYNGKVAIDLKLRYPQYVTNNSQFSDDGSIDINQLGPLYSYLANSGSMPNGKYQINLSLEKNNIILYNSPTIFFEINIPNTLELLSPGGPIENLSNSFIFNKSPLFTWYSDYCQLCNYSIRICEYNKNIHSSLEEALSDWSLIPSDQSQLYTNLGSMAQSFQYPPDAHINLEVGSNYVWQIKRSYNELFDEQVDYSDIFIFEVRSMDKMDKESENQYLTIIKSIIGPEDFKLTFGPGGELESFLPSSDMIDLNGDLINIEVLYSILSELESKNAKLESFIIK